MFAPAPAIHLTPLHFLIVCPLIFLASFIDSIAGGGGLISLPAYLISGLPVHMSIATNKLSAVPGTLVAVGKYTAAGYIDWKRSILPAAASLLGASIGASIALLIDDGLFRILMLIILPLTALYVLRKKDLFDGSAVRSLPFLRMTVLTCAIALALGMYDGFYGPGTGTFLILALSRFARLDLQHANGLAKVINLASGIASLFVYLASGSVVITLGLAAAVCSTLGGWFGSRSFTKKGASIARPVILLVLVVFFVRTVLELAGVI